MVGNHIPRTRTAAARLRRLGLLALLLPCACSLITSLDGLSGGASDASDAGPRADAPSDVRETSTTDGEAGDAGDAAVPFCSSLTTSPAFCADFDGVDPVAGWTRTLVLGNAGVVEPSTAAFTSAPRAVRSSVGVGGERFAFLERSLATADHVRLSYSIYVELRPTSDDYEVNILSFESAGTSYDFYLTIDGTAASYVQQISTASSGDSTPAPLTQAIATKKWTRVVLDVTLTGAREMVVTLDGVEAARRPIAYAAQPAPVKARAGITYASTVAGSGVVFIDDFLVELL